MRQNRVPLSIAEVSRVSGYFAIGQLPEIDAGQLLERAVRTLPCFAKIAEERAGEMVKQGRFLLQCAVKWFLATGRHPMPLVAAVVSFVAEVNCVAVDVEEIARDLLAGVATSKLRKKELVQTLVKAAKKILPWGEDVDVKNIVHNAPLLLRYMEIKSGSGEFGTGTFRIGVQDENFGQEEKDSVYFSTIAGKKEEDCEDVGSLKLSVNGLLGEVYKNALVACNQYLKKSSEAGEGSKRKRKTGGLVIDAQMSCLSTTTSPSLEQVLAKDVGYDPQPPSFLSGLEARKRRRERIRAAKIRIARIVNPNCLPVSTNVQKKDSVALKKQRGRRRRKGDRREGEIDWEDCIIELLLLHRVNEEEIEQGQYKRLMDLHIFDSISSKEEI